MFCIQCGNQLDTGARFCATCGSKVPGGAAETALPMPPPLPSVHATNGDRLRSSRGEGPRATGPLPDSADAPALHGGFWMRAAAYLIDWLICVVIMLVAGFATGLAEGLLFGHDVPGSGAVLAVLVAWIYWAAQESSSAQATLGKRALGLQVTDDHGRRIGFGRATGRFFAKILSGLILYIGYMMAGWTRRKQALHDLVAGTFVVRSETLAARAGGGGGVPASVGMPGWAVALIVVFAGMFLIVPILAAISIPAYQNYIVRAQVSEGMSLSGGARSAEVDFHNRSGYWPRDNAEAGLPEPEALAGKYVASVAVGGGSGDIVVRFSGAAANGAIRGRVLVLEPLTSGGFVRWRCDSPATTIEHKYLPSGCRGS